MKNRGDITTARNLISQFNGTHGRWLSNRDIPRPDRARISAVADSTRVEPVEPYRVERVIWRATYEECGIGEFVWNIADAADHWRLHQARMMIASISVKSQTTDQPVRAFVNVTIPGNESEEADWDRGYVSIEKSMESAPLQEQVLSYAKQQLVIWRRKFGAYEQFYGVANEIE